MDDRIDWSLLQRHCAGDCTLAEQAALESWAAADPARRELLRSAETIWARWGALRPSDADLESAWVRMDARVSTALPARPASSMVLPLPRLSLHAANARPWPRGVGQGGPLRRPRKHATAGVLAALGVGTIVVGLVASRASQHVSDRVTRDWTYATTAGQRETVMLPDGTELTLAPGSRLRLEGDYGAGSRNVDLEGEAAFSVTHDGTRPFAVHASGVVATDLGTRFVVRAYPDEAVSHVMVAEGRVTVRPAASRGQPRTGRREQLLAPRDVAEIDATGSITALRHVDPDAYFGWTVGRLVFSDATLAAVARDLTRWYGIPIEIRDPALREQQLVITLDRQPADVAVTLVAAAVGAHVRRVGAGYILTSSRP